MEQTNLKYVIAGVIIAIVVIVGGLMYITYRDKAVSEKKYPPEIQSRLDLLSSIKAEGVTETKTKEERLREVRDIKSEGGGLTTEQRLKALKDLEQ